MFDLCTCVIKRPKGSQKQVGFFVLSKSNLRLSDCSTRLFDCSFDLYANNGSRVHSNIMYNIHSEIGLVTVLKIRLIVLEFWLWNIFCLFFFLFSPSKSITHFVHFPTESISTWRPLCVLWLRPSLLRLTLRILRMLVTARYNRGW